jgi:hypothetical protein
MAHNKKQNDSKKGTKTATHIVAKNISLTYRMAKQGFLTIEVPEIEIWREQQ